MSFREMGVAEVGGKMKGKKIEGRIVDVYWGEYHNYCGCGSCYEGTDDWRKDIFADTIPEFCEAVVKFDSENDGDWDFYRTKIVRFEYDGKKYETNLYPDEGISKIDSNEILDRPEYECAYVKERMRLDAIQKKKDDVRRAEAKRKRNEKYEELKEEFEE